jgi:hypothetical protein
LQTHRKGEHIRKHNTIDDRLFIETMNNTASLSNGYDFVAATVQPFFYSFSVTMTFIIITSILNAAVLCRRTLRSSPCTYYFLASIPPVLAYVVVTPLNTIIVTVTGLHINGTPVSCKLVQFTVYGSSLLYALMLVGASVDRFCSSSNSARLRRFSQVHVARRVITIVWILALLYMSPFMVTYYYDYSSVNSNKCIAYTSTLAATYLMTRVILYYFILPILLAIFGTLTIYNIRGQRGRVGLVNRNNNNRRTEVQMVRMLIIQVIVYFLFFTPSGITYIIVTFAPSMNTQYYNAIRTLTVIWQQGGFFIAFFLYVLAGKVYRQELLKLFKLYQRSNRVTQITLPSTAKNVQRTAIPSIRV